MNVSSIACMVVGLIVVFAVTFDVFQAIIVPRVTSRTLRIGPFLIGRILWPLHKQIALPLARNLREGWLEVFAPASFLILLVVWFMLLICGFALMLFGLKDFVQPHIVNFSEAIYFAGTSVLTIGFGDLLASHWSTRVVVLTAAVTGLIFMALSVSYLFVLLTCIQQREQVVNTLMSRAGSPASGLVLLLRYRELDIVPSLSGAFVQWESWTAAILESHRAYPMLCYFRSSNRSNSWVSSLGAILDAGSLLSTTIANVSIGEAELFYWIAITTLKSTCEYFQITPEDGVHMGRKDFDDAIELLNDAGFTCKEPDLAWHNFRTRREGYMRFLVPLAREFMTPQQIWMITIPGL